MVAPDGAGPWRQITSVRPRLTSCTMIGTSPPGPLRCGSTTCSVKAVATPASKALPPFSSVAIPTAVAIQCVEVTTPKMPSISGRVVNGSGLILPMGCTLVVGRSRLAQWSTGAADCQLACQRHTSPKAPASGRRRRRVHRMAGDAVDQGRGLPPAQVECQRTARVEGAAGRRVDRVGDLALHGDALAAGHREVGNRT